MEIMILKTIVFTLCAKGNVNFPLRSKGTSLFLEMKKKEKRSMKKKVLQRRYGGYLVEPLSENLIPQKNLSLKWRKRLRKRWGGRLLSSSLGRGLKNLYEKQNLHFPIQSSLSKGFASGEVSGWATPPAKRLLEENLNHSLNNSGPAKQLPSEDLPMSGKTSSSSTRGEKGGEDSFVEMDEMVGVTPKRVRVEPFKPVFSAPLSLYGVHHFLHFKRKSSSERVANPYRLVPNPPLSNPSRGSGVHPNLKLNPKPFQGVPPVLTCLEVRTGEVGTGEVINGERRGLPLKGSEKIYLSSSLQIKGELTRLEGYKKSSLFKSQLSERKKLSIFYGNLSRRKLFELFNGGKENSLSLLERRADVALYRIGFFTTILSARQWIRHGRVLLNGQTLQVGSFLLSPGDSLSIPSRYHRFFMSFRVTKPSKRGGFSSLRHLTPLGVQVEETALSLCAQRKFSNPFNLKRGTRGNSSQVTKGRIAEWGLRECAVGKSSGEGFTLSFILPSFRLGSPHRLLMNELIRSFLHSLPPSGVQRKDTPFSKLSIPFAIPLEEGSIGESKLSLCAQRKFTIPLHLKRGGFAQNSAYNFSRGCEKRVFSPLKLYRKVTEEGGFSATQPLLAPPKKRTKGLGVPAVTRTFYKGNKGVGTREVRSGGVTPFGVRGRGTGGAIEKGGSTESVKGGENFPSPLKYLGGGRWSYSSRLPAPTLLEVTSEKKEEFFTPFHKRVHKRGGGDREAPRGNLLPQPHIKRRSLGGGNSLGIKPLKPTHLEVSYTHLTVIYLYYPQKISFPALMDLETIERSFRCGI